VRSYWYGALAAFVLAGATGAFLRFGLLYGMAGLDYANVRHAHSHLMFFSWLTPSLMALMAAQLPGLTGRPLSPWFARLIPTAIALGLLAYVPFLLFGYRSVTVGGATLPPAVIAASLSVLVWWAFARVYRRQTRGAPPTRTLALWNAAVLFLLLSTLGVIGLPIMIALDVQDPLWSMVFTHIFLDLFSEGWFVLGALGLAYAALPEAGRHRLARPSGDLLAVGLPVIFLLFIPTHLVPPVARWVGSVGGLLVVAGTLGNVAVLWGATSAAGGGAWHVLWRAPLVFLAIKAVALLGLLAPPVAYWAEVSQLRVSYLHWLLLGFATLAVFAAAERQWGVRGRRWMTAAVVVLVLTLLPLTGMWPPALGGLWRLHAAAWAALGPVVVAAYLTVEAIPWLAVPNE